MSTVPASSARWKVFASALALALIAVLARNYYAPAKRSSPLPSSRPAPQSVQGPSPGGGEEDDGDEPQSNDVRVEVVRPKLGGLERVTTMPGSIHAYEYAELFAQASGYLKYQPVDIGDHVHKDQVLAEIDVPDRAQDVVRRRASVLLADSQVQQAVARRAVAAAEVLAAESSVKESEAVLEKWTAARSLAEKQYRRINDLFKLNSIEEKLVDEKEEARSAAIAAQGAASAGIISAKAKVVAAKSQVELAAADIAMAKANVDAAKADLEKARVMAAFGKIVSPYDGVISLRNFHPGDFIRDAEHGGATALLTVMKTDVMRVVVQIPDRDVPFTDPGDLAEVEIDALPGTKFPGKVARISSFEDPQTRTMRTEVDLNNPKGVLLSGMYGRVTIRLAKGSAKAVRIPTSCLFGAAQDGKGVVYVAIGNKVAKRAITLGSDNGVEMEVTGGLSPQDDVVVSHSASLVDGLQVEVAHRNADESVQK